MTGFVFEHRIEARDKPFDEIREQEHIEELYNEYFSPEFVTRAELDALKLRPKFAFMLEPVIAERCEERMSRTWERSDAA